jgi:DNA-binding transcriptional ArsR family regulator
MLTSHDLDNFRRASRILGVYSNVNRLRILHRLSQGPCRVGVLEQELGILQPTLSQQLAVLRREGLVHTEKRAKYVWYRLSRGSADGALLMLADIYS